MTNHDYNYESNLDNKFTVTLTVPSAENLKITLKVTEWSFHQQKNCGLPSLDKTIPTVICDSRSQQYFT